MRNLAALASIAIGFVAVDASAQDDRRVGIVMRYPTAVGVIFDVTSNVAIRPEVAFSSSTSESNTLGSTKGEGTTVVVGLAGLVTVHKWDALRAYVAPSYSYQRSTSTTESTVLFIGFPGSMPLTDSRTSKGRGHAVTGSFGAQYTPHKHFAAFGEVGFGYDRTENVLPFSSVLTPPGSQNANIFRSHGWRTASNVGVIFFF